MRQTSCALLTFAALLCSTMYFSRARVEARAGRLDRQVAHLKHHPKSLTIATFNVQTFGERKLDKPHVMDVLTQVIRQFDIVAVQEIHARHADVLPRFIAKINADGGRYDYVLGPRQGSTEREEQFAFLYDTQRVTIDRSSVHTAEHPGIRLQRSPLVTRFVARGESKTPFSFRVVNVHLNPVTAVSEIDSLSQLVRKIQQNPDAEDDVIVVGDFNLDETHLKNLFGGSPITYAATSAQRKMPGACDNIVFNRQSTPEFTGRSGVYDFRDEFGLTLEEAKELTDHFPVWAQFSTSERGAVTHVAYRVSRLSQFAGFP